MARTYSNGYVFTNSGDRKAAGHPVHSVSWFDCAKWCNARSEMLGRRPCYTNAAGDYKQGDFEAGIVDEANGFRLPTHEEWEYAARGGHSDYLYPWGNSISSANANYGRNIDTTTPVDAYPPNDYDLYDMAGNVWEWCNDSYVVGERANAGGGFSASATGLQCGYPRDFPAVQPTGTRWHIGFRTVCRP